MIEKKYKKKKYKKKSDDIDKQSLNSMPLGKNNFIMMAIAGAMIVVGFLLMLGGSSTTEEFNPDIFSTRRIVVGPAICFLGFVGMAAAIWIKPHSKNRKRRRHSEEHDLISPEKSSQETK